MALSDEMDMADGKERSKGPTKAAVVSLAPIDPVVLMARFIKACQGADAEAADDALRAWHTAEHDAMDSGPPSESGEKY